MWARLKDSDTGQIAFDPKPSASRWYADGLVPFPAAAPPPENTVRIVTFWPSSRSPAIRPPQDSATSSGWGATNTWVMRAEYTEQRSSKRPAMPAAIVRTECQRQPPVPIEQPLAELAVALRN